METDRSINLISPQAKISGEQMRIAVVLQKAALAVLVAFIAASLIVGVLYFIMRQNYAASRTKRDQLQSQVSSFAATEAILVAMHDRLKLSEKVLSSQSHWGEPLSRIINIVSGEALPTVAVDEKHRMVLNIKTNVLEDNFPILTALISDVETKRILSPEVVSFTLNKDGVTNMVIAFYPTL